VGRLRLSPSPSLLSFFLRPSLPSFLGSLGGPGSCSEKAATVDLGAGGGVLDVSCLRLAAALAKFIYAFRDYYEPELAYLEKLLFRQGKSLLDAGAKLTGIYTAMASNGSGRGRQGNFP